jgi:hypothetical protein
MSKPSPRSRRPGRGRPGHRGIAVSAAARAILDGDYPQPVKMRVALASKGVLSGRRECVVCGEPGHTTRVWVPPAALRVVNPDYRGIVAYWVCAEHLALPEGDPELQAALRKRKH